MRNRSLDERAVSETLAVVILLVITLVMVTSVGIYVLAVDEDEVPNAEFGFDYDGSADTLLVRYVEGETYPAEDVLLSSGEREATWGDLASLGANGTVEPGDAIQLSGSGAWGEPITGVSEIDVYHVGGDNRTALANWTA